MGSIHQNGDRLREPKVGDTRRPAAGPGSRRWVDRLCRQHERQSSSCRRLSFTVEVCASDPSVCYQMCSVFLWETWLEKQAETTKGCLSSELGISRSITDHRSRSRVRASFLHMHCEPPKLFFCCCCVSRSTFHEFPFSFLFSPDSSVAQTLKNVDCKFRLLRRRSLGGKISVSEVMHLLTLNAFPVNFRVVLVVAFFLFFFFHSFSLLLSFFLSFFCGDFEPFFFFFE